MVSEPSALSVLALDAGGTSTRALIVDADSHVLAQRRGGPGNPRSAVSAATEIARVCHETIHEAGTEPASAVIALAGLVSVGGTHPETISALRSVGITCPIRLVSDLHGIYYSCTEAPTGAVLLAGTGATAASFNDGELTAVRDGLGWLLGDAGAGFWIGREVVQAVCAELDHRGPATSLTPLVVQQIGHLGSASPPRARELASIVNWVYSQRPVDLAQFAVLVSQESQRDAVAADIANRAAMHLIATLEALPPRPSSSPIVLGGSVLGTDSPVGRRLRGHLGERALHARDGLTGAAVLALRSIGAEPDRERIESRR